MTPLKVGAILVPILAIGAFAFARPMNALWHGDSMAGGSMMNGWPMGHRWAGPGPIPRHHIAMMQGIPAPYASMHNPLPQTEATLKRGAAVYVANCAACHGETGQGDGPAGKALSPPPGNLAWLSDMPMGQWDGFTYWTIAEGGAQFGTAMPAFKTSLSSNDIWAVTAYIQAHLPKEH